MDLFVRAGVTWYYVTIESLALAQAAFDEVIEPINITPDITLTYVDINNPDNLTAIQLMNLRWDIDITLNVLTLTKGVNADNFEISQEGIRLRNLYILTADTDENARLEDTDTQDYIQKVFIAENIAGETVSGAEITAGLGSINLELAQKITAMNENVGFTNTIGMVTYTPIWQEVTTGADTRPDIRVFDPYQLDIVGQAIDTFQVTNPDFVVTTTLGAERIFNFTFNFVAPINGVRFEFYVEGEPNPSWRSPVKDIVGTGLQQIGTMDNGGGRLIFQEPFDVKAGNYRIRLYSDEGDVIVKSNNIVSGSTFKPYYSFDGMAFTDVKIEPFTLAEKDKLAGITGGRYLGVFADLTALQTAYPTGVEGDHATVISPSNFIWYWDGAAWVSSGTGSEGDMLKAVYDPTNINASPFIRSNHTGTQLASTISNFDTEVSNNTSVVANTAKVTNATHTGEVTGDSVLTVGPTAISNKALVTAVTGQEILVNVGGVLKKINAGDFLLDGGTDYYYEESLGRNMTKSTTYQEKLSMTETFDAGDYFIEVYYGWDADQDNADFIAEVTLDTVRLLGEHVQEIKEKGRDQNIPAFRRFKVTLTAASHTIAVNYKSSDGTLEARISETSISVTKVNIL